MKTAQGSSIDRRSFLKWSAAGLMTLAVSQWGWVVAEGERRDLIVVSNAGDAKAGEAPSVSVIDPGSLEVLATLPMVDYFSFPATRWDPARDVIWSGLPAGPHDAVLAFELSSGKQIAEIPTGSKQNYTELTPSGDRLIVAARFQDRYLAIDADPASPDFGNVVAKRDTYAGASPCDITVSADGHYAYAPDRGGDTVTALDLNAFQVASVTPLEKLQPGPLQPYMSTVSPTGNVLFVENAIVKGASQTGSESIFDLSDPAHPAEVARLSVGDGLGRGPISDEFTGDGRYSLVICRDSSQVAVVDTASYQVVANVHFPEGSNPLTGTFAYADEGDTFFVPLPGRDAVAAITTPDFNLAKLIPVGAKPLGAVFLLAPLPSRKTASVPLGVALANGRTFPAGCPDRCCGPV